MRRAPAAVLVLLGVSLASVLARAEPHRVAIVVGANESKRPGLATLQFADDDALRNYELLTAAGYETTLLTTPDTPTQEEDKTRAEQLIPRSRPARRAELDVAIQAALASLATAKAAGLETELLFWFDGHGGADGAEFAMFLEGGDVFRQADLKRLIEQSPASFNHVVIDACHASSLLAGRGEDPATEAMLNEIAQGTLDGGVHTWKNEERTGWIVALGGADAKTYEWKEYRAGVASHEIRSALAGAADISGDSRVSYSEVDGFVFSANRDVSLSARPEVSVRPPRSRLRHPIIDWHGARSPRLEIGPELEGHVFVSDAHGNRLVELNKAERQPVRVMLPVRSRYYATVNRRQLAAFHVEEGASVHLERLTGGQLGSSPAGRGLLDDAFSEGLFKAGFSRDTYWTLCQPKGTCEVLPALLPPAPPPPPVAPAPRVDEKTSAPRFGALPYVLFGVAAVAGGTAAVSFQASEKAYTRYKSAPPEGKPRYESMTRDWDWATSVALGVAGTAAGAGAGLLIWDYATRDAAVSLDARGVTLSGSF